MKTREGNFFDHIADVYDETRGIPEPYFSRLLDKMEEYLAKKERTLDVGVGTGRFARPLQARGHEVIGADISREMMMVGRSQGLRDFLFADACHLPFKDNAFHTTLSIHLLHLLPGWRDALREAIRVTRENFITVKRVWLNEETPHKLYTELATKNGHLRKSLGMSEKDFPEKVVPFAEDFLGTRKESVPAEIGIERCESRIYSGLPDVPDDVHENTIRKLREEYGGQMIDVEEEIYLLVWKIDDLKRSLIEGAFED